MTSEFEQYLGEGKKIKLGEKEWTFRSLDTDYLPDLFKIINGVDNGKFNEEAQTALKRLVEETIKKSYPNEPENLRKEFAFKHLMDLIGIVIDVNSIPGENSQGRGKVVVDTIKKLQSGQAPPIKESG